MLIYRDLLEYWNFAWYYPFQIRVNYKGTDQTAPLLFACQQSQACFACVKWTQNTYRLVRPIKVCLTLSLLAVTCNLLITFSNNLDPDQDPQNVYLSLQSVCHSDSVKKLI